MRFSVRQALAVGLASAALLGGVAAPVSAQEGPNGAASSSSRVAVQQQEFMIDLGDWFSFTFGDVGDSVSFEFTSIQPTIVSVTDAFCTGDEFDVIVDGVRVGPTSPTTDASCDQIVDDPDLAFADPRFSSGAFRVPAGQHTVIVEVTASPFTAGGAFIRVDPVPTPVSKDDCKKGGWQEFTDADGQPFRNQGQCVSYVARTQRR